MSDCWFNLRIFWFHFQAKRGYLFKWSVDENEYWKNGRWKEKWIELYECDFKEAWGN